MPEWSLKTGIVTRGNQIYLWLKQHRLGAKPSHFLWSNVDRDGRPTLSGFSAPIFLSLQTPLAKYGNIVAKIHVARCPKSVETSIFPARFANMFVNCSESFLISFSITENHWNDGIASPVTSALAACPGELTEGLIQIPWIVLGGPPHGLYVDNNHMGLFPFQMV